MRLKRHQDAGSFLKEAQSYLEQAESANNLILGLALNIEQDPRPYGNMPYLATVEDAAGVAAAAVMTPPWVRQRLCGRVELTDAGSRVGVLRTVYRSFQPDLKQHLSKDRLPAGVRFRRIQVWLVVLPS